MNFRFDLSGIRIAIVHLTGWVILLFILKGVLAPQADDIVVVNGMQTSVLPRYSLLPYILVAIVAKIAWVYTCGLWVFPVYLKKNKITAGTGVLAILLTAIATLEFIGFEILNANGGFQGPQMEQVGNYRVLVMPSTGERLKESIFTWWNTGLYAFGLALAFAGFFLRERRMSVQASDEPLPPSLITGTDAEAQSTPESRPLVEPPPSNPETVLLKSGTQTHRIPASDILFLKKEGNYFTVFTQSGKIVIRQNMESMLNLLPAEDFARIHRSYIIARRHVAGIENHHIRIGPHRLPVSDTYKNQLAYLFFKTTPPSL